MTPPFTAVPPIPAVVMMTRVITIIRIIIRIVVIITNSLMMTTPTPIVIIVAVVVVGSGSNSTLDSMLLSNGSLHSHKIDAVLSLCLCHRCPVPLIPRVVREAATCLILEQEHHEILRGE